VDLVMLVVPSVAHEAYARALAPILEKSQTVFLNPGHTGGALHFAAALKRAGGPEVPLCESTTLTYICRMEGENAVGIYRETKHLHFAALPARRTPEMIQHLRPLFPNLTPATDVLQTGLMNINAVIHPPGMLMNAGWIEFTDGKFLFYKEALTPSVARVIEAVDRERLAVAEKMGVPIPPFIAYFQEAGLTSEGARRSGSVYRAMQESRPNRTIQSPPSLDHRYVEEDVGCGLVPMTAWAGRAGVPTPTMDALITLASAARNKDFRKDGLTLEKMGIAGQSVEALRNVV
jgi:opine dehydrogenase